MAINNYQELLTRVADYLARGDCTQDELAFFVALGEARINRNLRARAMERIVALHAEPGDAKVALPEDFLEMRNLYVNAGKPCELKYVTPSALVERMGEKGGATGYTVVGNDLMLAPVPDGAVELSLCYYASLQPLSQDRPSNIILKKFPDLYLYAALVESVSYVRGSVPGDTWAAYYSAALSDIMESEKKARFGKQLRMRPPRR